MNKKQTFISSILALIILFSTIFPAFAQQSDMSDLSDDFELYQKYSLFLKYEKKQFYLNYLALQKYKKYNIKKESRRIAFQQEHDLYALYLQDKELNAKYKKFKKSYVTYQRYLKYAQYAPYAKYKNYKKYNKKKYNTGKDYGGQEYKDGYDRYLAAQNGAAIGLGEADLGSGIIGTDGKYLGPSISIGLVKYSKSNLRDSAFKLEKAFNATTGNAIDYVIKDANGTVLAQIPGSKSTKVKYLDEKNFTVYDSVANPLTVSNEIRFEAANANDANDIVFDFNRPSSDFDQYRGSLRIYYAEIEDASDEIWAINTLPLEQYVWGMGEMAGTGPINHSRVMTTVFRTYGYWKIKFSKKYALQDFTVNATPGNQIYYGYQWEEGHPNIRKAAQDTQGKLVMYNNSNAGINEIALTPYSSWTDGKTRSFEDRWGSDDYPWCKSVKDSYGKHPTMSTSELVEAGNHMVGLSAHGSLKLAGSKYDWKWDRILTYYFKGINLLKAY